MPRIASSASSGARRGLGVDAAELEERLRRLRRRRAQARLLRLPLRLELELAHHHALPHRALVLVGEALRAVAILSAAARSVACVAISSSFAPSRRRAAAPPPRRCTTAGSPARTASWTPSRGKTKSPGAAPSGAAPQKLLGRVRTLSGEYSAAEPSGATYAASVKSAVCRGHSKLSVSPPSGQRHRRRDGRTSRSRSYVKRTWVLSGHISCATQRASPPADGGRLPSRAISCRRSRTSLRGEQVRLGAALDELLGYVDAAPRDPPRSPCRQLVGARIRHEALV